MAPPSFVLKNVGLRPCDRRQFAASSLSAPVPRSRGVGAEPIVALVSSSDDLLDLEPDVRPWLTPDERRRASAFIDNRRAREFVAAHVLVRIAAGQLIGTAPWELAIVQRCDRCAGPHGVPRVVSHPAVHVSLSHTRGWVAAAAGFQRLAIDVEVVDQHIPYRLSIVRKVLSVDEARRIGAATHPEQALLRYWTRKECLVKLGAIGLGQMARVDLTAVGNQQAERTIAVPFGGRDVSFRDWTSASGDVVGALATEGRRDLPAWVDDFGSRNTS